MESENKTNPIFIKKITLRNFLTYKDIEVNFSQNIHTIIGPNECGKTNLLTSIQLMKNLPKLNMDCTCAYADNFNKTRPMLEFEIGRDFLREILGCDTKDGMSTSITLSDGNVRPKVISVIKKENIRLTISNLSKTNAVPVQCPTVLKLLKKPLPHNIPPDKNVIIQIDDKRDIALIIEYYDQKQPKNLDLLFESDYCNIDEEIDSLELLNKIKIVDWKYDESQYIKNSVSIPELQSSPQLNKFMVNMFKLAGYEIKDYVGVKNQYQRKNILREIEESVSEILHESWTQYQNVNIKISAGNSNNLIVSFEENGRETDPRVRSEGFKWFLAFLLYFNANFGNKLENCILLFDEPGLHLHPGGQRDLLRELDKLSLKNQIIYTTHLPFMINRNFPERIIYLKKIDGLTQVLEPRKSGIIDDILIGNTLGFSMTSISNYGAVNLFVEGITDKILLESFIQCYAVGSGEVLLDLNLISIIPTNGTDNMKSFIRVAQETGLKFLILLDGDAAGIKLYDHLKKHDKKYQKAHEYSYLLPDKKEIEDCLPIEIINQCYKILSEKIDPWNKFDNGYVFSPDKSITSQYKENIKKIKSSKEDLNEEIIDINCGMLKLDMALILKDKISLCNHDYKVLIDILKEVNSRAISLCE